MILDSIARGSISFPTLLGLPPIFIKSAEKSVAAPSAPVAEEAPKEEETPVAEEAPKEEETPGEIELGFDEFRPGDNVTVNLKIIEGDRQRTQAFQGDVIKGRFIKNSPPPVTSTFLVRRIASGVGVERIFPYFSPSIESVKLNRRGKVKQARIYYMRDRSGKSARIKERRI